MRLSWLLPLLLACGGSPPAAAPSPPAPAPAACVATGCSGSVCADAADERMTTCEFQPAYACYRSATCARQPDGGCGWTATPELTACLANPPAM